MNIQTIIKNRRLELGLTMKDVAKILGVSEATVSRYESGEIQNMGIDKIETLARALRCSPGYLMGWEDRVEGDPVGSATLDAEMIMDPECRELCSYFRKLNNVNRKIVLDLARSLSDSAAT